MSMNIIQDREGILQAVTSFYKMLCGEEETKNQMWESKSTEGKGREEEEPTIIKREVELAINRLKNGKAIGPDAIENESIKISKNSIVPHLTKTFSVMIKNNGIPKQCIMLK